MNGNQAGLAAMIEARAEELRLTKDRLAQLADISDGVLRPSNLLNRGLSPKSKIGLERALRWEVGSIDRYLRTGEAPRVMREFSNPRERRQREQEIRAQIEIIDARIREMERRRRELAEELMVFVSEGDG